MSDGVYNCSPRETRSHIVDCIKAGLVPFVRSSPGIGKSSIMRSIAKEFNLYLKDHRMSTSSPEDLSGLPRFNEYGEAVFAPFTELFPLDYSTVPIGYDGWMVFLDEFNSASKSVQAASYKLILDRMVGQHNLHERVILTAAGNLATDRAITNEISTAMQSRVVHIQMREDFEEWLKDVAIPEKYDPRIIAFLNQYPGKLMDFRPDHQDKTFTCPRTWEFMNKLIKGKEFKEYTNERGQLVYEMEGKTALFAGTITASMAVEFVQFTKVFNHLVNIRDVLSDPENCPIPNDNSTRWATITHLIEHISEKNISPLSKYANRFSLDFKILFFRSMMVHHPELRSHPEFAKALIELSTYLND